MMENCTAQIQEQQYEDVLSVLPELQQLVVDFGTLLEEVRGETNPCVQKVVAKIQEYCDALYASYEQLNTHLQEPGAPEAGQQSVDVPEADATVRASYEAFARSYTKMKAEIQQFCIARRSVLFICTGMREWHAYEHLCDEERQRQIRMYISSVCRQYSKTFMDMQSMGRTRKMQTQCVYKIIYRICTENSQIIYSSCHGRR